MNIFWVWFYVSIRTVQVEQYHKDNQLILKFVDRPLEVPLSEDETSKIEKRKKNIMKLGIFKMPNVNCFKEKLKVSFRKKNLTRILESSNWIAFRRTQNWISLKFCLNVSCFIYWFPQDERRLLLFTLFNSSMLSSS